MLYGLSVDNQNYLLNQVLLSGGGGALSSVFTRRDIAARCRGAMDAENGLQRNQQGRLH